MIDLTKFKNTEENAQNRAQITQIGVLGAIDAYFEGNTDFTEEELQRMVLNNITKIGVYAGVSKAEEDTKESTTTTEEPKDEEPKDEEPKDEEPKDEEDETNDNGEDIEIDE